MIAACASDNSGGARIRMTRSQRYCGFVIIGGIALYAIVGVMRYVEFFVSGPSVPDKAALARTNGRLVSAKRYGGKTKRQNLLIKIEGESDAFLYGPRAGEVDRVEEALKKSSGEVVLLYHPKSTDVYEIQRGGSVIRAYDETSVSYRESIASQAHIRGFLALGLLIIAIVLAIGLFKTAATTAGVS